MLGSCYPLAAVRPQARPMLDVIPPPVLSNWIVYYEASRGTSLSGSPVATYAKIDAWAPAYGSGSLAQATDANRMRWRSDGLYPVVYQSQAEGSRTMANTTAVINKQDASIFCLVELGQLIVNGIAENQTLVSLPGAVGELYLNKAAANHFKVAWKDGTGTYVSSLVPRSSLNLIGVTLSAGAVVVHCNGASETLAAVALAAGTVTGFSINFGTLAYGDAWGYNFVGVTNNALDAGELAAVESWAKTSRKARFPSDTAITKNIFNVGASRGVGYYGDGNIMHGRLLHWDNWQTSDHLITAFGGINTTNLASRIRTELGLQYEGGSNVPDTGFHSSTKNQVVIIEIPTADVTAGTAEATIIANLTQIRLELRQSGYDCIMNALVPCVSPAAWDAAQLTKMANINAAMAALDTRKYGDFVAAPTELASPGDADGVHYTQAQYRALYTLNKPYLDSYLSRTITTLKGHWKLNGDLLDYSGYRRDLQAIGSPTYTTGLNGGQALVCTSGGVGAAKGVYVGREYDVGTFTAVVFFQAKATGDHWLMMKQPASGNIWNIHRHSTGQIRSSVTGVTATIAAVDKSYAVDTWYGVALVVDPVNGGRLYTTSAGGDPTTFALRDTRAWSAGAVVPSTGSGAGAIRFGSYNSDSTTTSTWIQNPKVLFEALSLAQLQALSTTS